MMHTPPPSPRIYHITHVDNLPAIITAGELWSDARVNASQASVAPIGINNIKARRLRLPVAGHAGLCVGDCVPFYFCPRSVMLYLLHKGNHPDVTYKGGQDPIVHLEADLRGSVGWLAGQGKRWAFSLGNAGGYATEFRTELADLHEIDWPAVANTDFRSRSVKEAKQAEFLAENCFTWTLVQRIGVRSQGTATRVLGALAGGSHRPPVRVEPSWYY